MRRPIFTTLGEMTGVDKIMNPQHCGSDLADIHIRIRINPETWINPEIRIRIPDHKYLYRIDIGKGDIDPPLDCVLLGRSYV